MKRKSLTGIGVALAMVLPLACSSPTPLTPTPPTSSTPPADGTTLKVAAPSLVSPINGQAVNTRQPALVFTRSRGQFAAPQVTYEIQVTTPAGDTVYARTVAGGAADGNGNVTHNVESALGQNGQYRWRVRAVIGSDAGPWSNAASGATMFITRGLSASSSNDDFRDFFFSLIAQKGVGPIASAEALAVMEPDLAAVGILLERTSGGVVRGRLYLPSGNSNLFARSVDIGNYGGPWQWVPRGQTTCEGTCP